MATKTVGRKTSHLTVGQSTVVSTVEWLVSLIILAIPLVGLIMMFVWAFGGNTNYNKRNFARAGLILMVVSIVLGIIFSIAARSLFQGVVGPLLELIGTS